MHRINYKGGDFDYMDSKRVPELYRDMLARKKAIMVWNNIRDTFDIKNVVEVKPEEAMIFELLKEVDSYTEKEVRKEINLYNNKLSPQVVKNMILKYKDK